MLEYFLRGRRRYFFGIAVALWFLLWSYNRWFSVTDIALINYREFQVARFADAVEGERVSLESVPLSELDRASDYDIALVFGRGLSLDAAQRQSLRRAGESGTAVIVAPGGGSGAGLTNIDAEDAAVISRYLASGGKANYRNLMRYLRAHVDKKLFVEASGVPLKIDSDVLFHLDENRLFTSVEDYSHYYANLPGYSPEGKKIALLTSVPGPFNANRDHLNGLITTLESRGWRVYPVAAHSRRLEILQKIAPDLVIMLPHGRLQPDQLGKQGDENAAVSWLKSSNIPLLAPLTVFEEFREWKDNPQGYSGPLLTMNLVLPELDGATTPYVINALFENPQGLKIFDNIPERVSRFADLIERIFKLRDSDNSRKKIAIVFFRGPGENALVAGDMEVAPSLYNTLRNLRDAGYDVSGLPDSFAEFKRALDIQARVMVPYAQGLLKEFLQQADPVRIKPEQYIQWCRALPGGVCSEIERRYGPAPGDFMVDREGNLAVARLQYGNVVLLPQPLPGIGEGSYRLVHGTGSAPPHSYAAVYLWLRHGFGADAVVHFGTHGSLEFTPGKQVALSDSDWPDALLGGNAPFLCVHHVECGRGYYRQAAQLRCTCQPFDTAVYVFRSLQRIAQPAEPAAGL